jgi:hypothetical protein
MWLRPVTSQAPSATGRQQPIPNRHARAKIPHQAKKKRAQWHGPQVEEATPPGQVRDHEERQRHPPREGVQAREGRGPDEEPQGGERVEETARSAKVVRGALIHRSGEDHVVHAQRGQVPRHWELRPRCLWDCFWDICSNVASVSLCTTKYCKLGARCSNAPRAPDTLKLYDTGRVGLGVYTTTALNVGYVIGDYCGELAEFAAVVEGQPAHALKHNSGYTMPYNAKSVLGNYADALRSITRFLSHPCQPNAAFVEQQTRSRVRVLVKMIMNVQEGAQENVHYGIERWFKCACDRC